MIRFSLSHARQNATLVSRNSACFFFFLRRKFVLLTTEKDKGWLLILVFVLVRDNKRSIISSSFIQGKQTELSTLNAVRATFRGAGMAQW